MAGQPLGGFLLYSRVVEHCFQLSSRISHNNSMEIDEPELAGPSTTRKVTYRPVDDAHPFDLEAYLSSYTGM